MQAVFVLDSFEEVSKLEMFSDAPRPKLLMKNIGYEKFKLNENQFYVGSGKSGINLILGHMRASGDLGSKNSQILVPRWMGQWVYIAMLNNGIPVFEFSKGVKCIYVYHQFGFLQNLLDIAQFANENDLLIIEDSAHLLKIECNQSKINFLGHHSISSPPKFFSMPPIGILESSDALLRDYVSIEKSNSSKLKPYIMSIRQSYIGRRTSLKKPNKNLLDELNYKLYSSYLFTHNTTFNAVDRLSSLAHEYEIRLERMQLVYSHFEQQRLPIMTAQQSNIAVLKVPIFVSDKEIDLLASREPWALNYLIHFDRNQNLLKPNYQKAIAIPMHAQISESEFANTISKLASLLK